jgi:hypothetical protein
MAILGMNGIKLAKIHDLKWLHRLCCRLFCVKAEGVASMAHAIE